MNNKKSYKRQTGSISKIFTILILGGLGYSVFIAKNQGIISFDKTQDFLSNLSSTVSENISNTNNFSGYGIQLLATQELKQARLIMDDFARDGYSAFVLASKANGQTLYKVRLGPYTHKPEAVAIQTNVVNRYPNSPYAKDSLVIYKAN